MMEHDDEPGIATDAADDGRGVLCAKCEHLNPPGSNVCETCEAHLWIACNHCGTRNERVRSRCTKCRRRLHRTAFGRVRRLFRGGRTRVSPVHVLFLLIAIAAAYYVITSIANMSFPGF